MRIEHYKDGQKICTEFYKRHCCNEDNLPKNPNKHESEGWKSWNEL